MNNIQHAVITGASRGIGKALAIALGTPERHLTLIGRTKADLEHVQAQCQRQGAQVEICLLDLKDNAAIQSTIHAIAKKNPIDLLIANAGVSYVTDNRHPESFSHHEETFLINIQATCHTIQSVLPDMIARRHGQIVVMSSIAGLIPLPQSPAYCASKAAVMAYALSLRRLLAQHNIKINVVCPGYIDTNMSQKLTKRPFLLTPEKAAQKILNAAAKNKARYIFPWQMQVLYWLSSLAPHRLLEKQMIRFKA